VSWIEEPLMAKGGNYSLLAAHRHLNGSTVENVTLNNRQVWLINLKP